MGLAQYGLTAIGGGNPHLKFSALKPIKNWALNNLRNGYGWKMDIRKKENEGLNISVKLDKFYYKKFIENLKTLGQSYEHKSDKNKLDYSILANCHKLPYIKVKDWCRRCIDKNGRVSEVFFCDYDNILYRIVQDEARYIYEEHDETPIYVFVSEEDKDNNGELYGNYMLVSLKKHSFRDVITIQDNLHCDEAYKRIPLIYRFKTYVLRLGNKGKKKRPKFKEIIGDLSKEYTQEVSQAHLEALKVLYPKIPDVKYKNLDGNKINKLFVTEYITASKWRWFYGL